MNIQYKFDNNTILHYVSNREWTYDDNDKEVTLVYELSFSFYDCHYIITIKKKDIENDNEFFLNEGDSKLFDSFEDFVYDNWETIIEKCRDFDYWLDELNKED